MSHKITKQEFKEDRQWMSQREDGSQARVELLSKGLSANTYGVLVQRPTSSGAEAEYIRFDDVPASLSAERAKSWMKENGYA